MGIEAVYTPALGLRDGRICGRGIVHSVAAKAERAKRGTRNEGEIVGQRSDLDLSVDGS